MIANQDIENELAVLLSLSNEMTRVRTVQDLENAIRLKLKKLFHLKDFTILVINSDKKTWSHFVSCRDDALKDDKQFQDYMSRKYDVNDQLFNMVLQAESFYIFHMEDMMRWAVVPDYIKYWRLLGIEYSVCFPLSNGVENIGVLYFQPERIELLDTLNYTILKGVASQISIAVCNIIANEEIAKRESERELLLALNIDIAAVRDNNDFLHVIKQKLKKLLTFSHTLIATVNDDKATVSAFLLDPESKSKMHPDYKDAKIFKYLINDGVIDKAMATGVPVVFDLNELNKNKTKELPLYLKVNFESGISQVAVIRFSKAGEAFGFWMIFFDKITALDDSKISLIVGLANQMWQK